MDIEPKICIGHVVHRRLRPAVNAFVYPVFYVLLPLRNLNASKNAFFALNKPNLLSFYARDHGPRDGGDLLAWIENVLQAHDLPRDGEIVLQTFPRVLGFVFNPVSFWYCHDRAQRLVAVLAEVNNTFGGTHCYVLHRQGEPLVAGEELHADKCFHVSPFNRIEGVYRFRFRVDGARHRVDIDYDDGSGELLTTAIAGRPQVWSAPKIIATFLRMPLLTLGVIVRIHWQALKLWLKGVRFHGANPVSSPTPESTR